ncbi:MAG: polysaccharide deacetylase family protein [Gammaproteobacteria bacterium]|nr:polysaccharide deacetylase family protein [Gammaproteobacteria bacterium]
MTDKPKMTLSLDLDNKWSYLKTHGDSQWTEHPSYFDLVIPRILDFLKKRDLTITFFIVGQDAALEKNQEALKLIPAAGHEIANHSFHHEPWLHLYSRDELNQELQRAEEVLESVTGVKVNGFRGPGFSLSSTTLEVLKARGYAYDATAFPNILNPLARAYFFSTSNLTDEEKEQRKALFGSYSDAFRPVKPYRWNLTEGPLLELPVTTMPLFKVPIHFSYLVYLAGYSETIARLYVRTVNTLCRMTGTEPSLLLHPLDFMGKDDDKDLAFFPAMNMTSERKLELMDGFFSLLMNRFDALPIGEYVTSLQEQSPLTLREPRFSHST